MCFVLWKVLMSAVLSSVVFFVCFFCQDMRICCVDKITQTFYVDIDCLDLLLVAAAWVASTVLKGTLGVRTCCVFFKGN